MRRIIYSVLTMLTLVPMMSRAQEQPTPLSLQDAMDYAVKNNVNAKNARLDYLIQKAKNAEITGIALPQVNAKGEFTDYVKPIKTFVPAEFGGGAPGTFIPLQFMPQFSNTATLSASQIIFDGSVLVALQARNTILKLSEQNTSLTEQELRYNVQKAYYSLVAARRQQEILNNSLAYLRKISGDIAATYQAGFVEKIDVDRAQVSVNNLATDSIRVGSLLLVSEQLLKYQMGMDIAQPIVLTDSSVEDKLVEARELMGTELNYENRTEFGLLQNQLKLNEYDVKRYKFQALPSLTAFGSAAYNYSSNNFKDLFNQQYIFYSLVGLQLNVPIFSGLQRQKRVVQAKLNVEKTKNSIYYLKQSLDFQEAQSKTMLRNSLLALEAQQKNYELANSVLDLAKKKYDAGVGSNLEVSEAQTQMLQAQGNFFNAMLDVVNASSELKRALGEFK